MSRYRQHLGAFISAVVTAGLFSQAAVAADKPDEELITIGSRSLEGRSIADSPVPIDVVGTEDLNSVGNSADLTESLRALIPSYTASPLTGDGSAFVRPTSLRGTASDQTLVLVNGKRRHRSALIQFLAPAAGNGSHSPDIGMIPGIAVKRVEVLRDGASAQYGSDAIAGVINFVMKDAAEGGEVQVQYGQHYEGEQSYKVSANGGFAAGENGFINLSFEYIDNEGLSRGQQLPSAQALLDTDPNNPVGQDAVFGDAPFAQSWGRAESSGARFFVNSGFELSESSDLYARFGYADTEGRYRFFFRHPTDHSFFTTPLSGPTGCPTCAPGETMNLREQGFVGLTGGFTPYLDGDQKDASLALGIEGQFESGMFYDFSVNYGSNELVYFLNNSGNNSLGPGDLVNLPQMDFDVGGYRQEEIGVNADLSLPLADNVNLGFGAEWREETYTALAGELTSFFENGVSGLKGVTTDDAGQAKRDNIAVYADLEHDITESVLLQYAVRYEDFSDFGSTINGKLAAGWRLGEAFALRGAVSTGFHAPTPGQASVRTTITTADSFSGLLVEEGLFPPTDPAAVAVGGKPLVEETSVNFSVGFTWEVLESTSLTLDVYKIEVDDRIYKTGNIPVDPADPDLGSISFFTNALDVEHTGVDLVLTSVTEWASWFSTDWTLALSYNDVDVVDQKFVTTPDGRSIQPVSDASVEDIENNFPNERGVLTMNNVFGDSWTFMIRANYYGDHYDERGTINDPADQSAKIGSTIYVDLDLGLQLNDNWRFNVCAVNVFDEFIDEVGPPNANRLGNGLQYPRRSAANYEGGFWYARGTFSF